MTLEVDKEYTFYPGSMHECTVEIRAIIDEEYVVYRRYHTQKQEYTYTMVLIKLFMIYISNESNHVPYNVANP